MTAIRVVPYVDTIDVALADADIHRVRAASTASCKHPREGPRAEALTSHASMPVLDAVSVASPPTSASCFQPPRSSAHAVDQRSMLGGLEAISGDHRASLCESERASTVSFFSIATHVVGVVVICRACRWQGACKRYAACQQRSRFFMRQTRGPKQNSRPAARQALLR